MRKHCDPSARRGKKKKKRSGEEGRGVESGREQGEGEEEKGTGARVSRSLVERRREDGG